MATLDDLCVYLCVRVSRSQPLFQQADSQSRNTPMVKNVNALIFREAQLPGNTGRIVIIATFDYFTVIDTHHTTVASFHSSSSGRESAEAGMEWACMCATIQELHHRPVALNNDVCHLDLAIWKGLAPPMVIALVTLWTRQQFASCHILKVAILRDHSRATVRVSHVPGFVKDPDDTFDFSN